MAKGPYDEDFDDGPVSEPVTDPSEIVKMQLNSEFVRITKNLETSEILEKTGLHKSDYSRLRAGIVDRFSLDRLIKLLHLYNCEVSVSVNDSKEAS